MKRVLIFFKPPKSMIKKTGEFHTLFDLITNRMKYLLLLFFFAPISIWADTVPIEGNWDEKGLRSLSFIPFTVDKDRNTLFIYSDKAIDNVFIRIVSTEGILHCEEVYSFSVYETISISLNDLPAGNFTIQVTHLNGELNGEFINP